MVTEIWVNVGSGNGKGWLIEAQWHLYVSVNFIHFVSGNGLSLIWHQAIT